MKLINVHVTNFRCIDDSTPFQIDDVTCLVGKNESGKTSILQALERLNPYDKNRAKYDKLRDYPRRHLSDYKVRHKYGEAKVLHTIWELDAGEVKILEAEFGAGCLVKKTIAVEKYYESSGRNWTISLIDEQKIIEHLLKKDGCSTEEIAEYKDCVSAQDLLERLNDAETLTTGLEAIKKRIESYRNNDIGIKAIDIVSKYMPEFMYFSNYDLMSGEVPIEELKRHRDNKQLSAGEEVFLAFLEFAGTSLEEVSKIKHYEDLQAKVEAASIKITKQIFEYWSQNRYLKVQFRIDAARPDDPAPLNTGNIMRARVYNQLHDMTVSFNDRSAGFIWFFSFLVMFSQVKNDIGNVIILLDEPGLNLHAKAQGDLLRYIEEKLKPEHQVIYTTHSPFMIPANNLASVRTVEDVIKQTSPFDFEPLGTKVSSDILTTDKDTLFPLQGALGYEISQTLFVGEHTLLVEGPSDVLYIQAASGALKSKGRVGLDPRWVICPTGGIDKISAFISLFGGNKLHVAVLTDFAKGQKTKLENLKRSQLLQEGHVYSVTDFCDKDEADTEDLFGDEVYIDIVNSAYTLGTDNGLESVKVTEETPETPRIVPKVEAAFRVMPSEVPGFDHFTPSSWLIRNPKFLEGKGKDIGVALDRWEKVFIAFNSLLDAQPAVANDRLAGVR